MLTQTGLFITIQTNHKKNFNTMPYKTKEIYDRNENGELVLVTTEQYWVDEIDPIKQKEEELLKLYAELEALKNKQQ